MLMLTKCLDFTAIRDDYEMVHLHAWHKWVQVPFSLLVLPKRTTDATFDPSSATKDSQVMQPSRGMLMMAKLLLCDK